MTLCSNDTCGNLAQRRGLCWKHYHRRRRMTDETRTPTRQVPTIPGPCACPNPIIMAVGMFPGAMMCQRCGRPPVESLGVTS